MNRKPHMHSTISHLGSSGAGQAPGFSRVARKILTLWITACISVALLAIPAAHAGQLSHQNPPPVKQGWNATAVGKLAAAKNYAEWFLAEDARPEHAFFMRDIHSSAWKDQPLDQCAPQAIFRAIKAKEAYFEDKRQKVVVVPVWVELLMIKTSINGGGSFEEENGNSCTFQYERYNFQTRRFEAIPGFRDRSFSQEFFQWGGSIAVDPERWGTKIDQARAIAPDLPLRYVRFFFRISVARDAPYQLKPQFPRHFPAEAAIAKLERIIAETKYDLARHVSDRDPQVTGKTLEQDLKRMDQQNFNRSWQVLRLKDSLERLRGTPPFSEIEP